jgi:hypothetical protein
MESTAWGGVSPPGVSWVVNSLLRREAGTKKLEAGKKKQEGRSWKEEAASDVFSYPLPPGGMCR